VFIARAMCNCLVLQLQSAEVSRTVTSSFVWSWTISVNVNEGIQDSEIWTEYSSFVSALFTVYLNSIQFICISIIHCLFELNTVHLYQHYSLFIWTQYSSFGSALITVYLNSIQFIWISIIHCLCTINSSTLDVGIIASVCAACPTDRLNWSSSSVPPGTISTIRSPPGPRRIQHTELTFWHPSFTFKF